MYAFRVLPCQVTFRFVLSTLFPNGADMPYLTLMLSLTHYNNILVSIIKVLQPQLDFLCVCVLLSACCSCCYVLLTCNRTSCVQWADLREPTLLPHNLDRETKT